MILVVLGTQDKEFTRLPIEIERLVEIGKITDKVIIQIGNTKFKTKLAEDKIEIIKFNSPDEMKQLIRNADLLITHGGVATIIEGLNFGKKIIAVPRLKQYKEHVNNHQLQIIENFNDKGYIIGTNGIEDISTALDKVNNFIPKEYESNNKEFVSKLEEKIIKLSNNR